ncbi:hypothetical protein NDU88_004238 [Pleurodeles waltl]|uniref:Uncharacterized protein n=1 Tax=Pleurodeles waltl TaxID=8319 RepID=A0AAV7UEI4_PLEWA|nr:hypothetical protein NDU88_004238 [Pleurodeles waltl]
MVRGILARAKCGVWRHVINPYLGHPCADPGGNIESEARPRDSQLKCKQNGSHKKAEAQPTSVAPYRHVRQGFLKAEKEERHATRRVSVVKSHMTKWLEETDGTNQCLCEKTQRNNEVPALKA